MAGASASYDEAQQRQSDFDGRLPATGPISDGMTRTQQALRDAGSDYDTAASLTEGLPGVAARAGGRALQSGLTLAGAAMAPVVDLAKRGIYGAAGYEPANPTQYTDAAGGAVGDMLSAPSAVGNAARAAGQLYKGAIAGLPDAVPARPAAPSVAVTPAASRGPTSYGMNSRDDAFNPYGTAAATPAAAPAPTSAPVAPSGLPANGPVYTVPNTPSAPGPTITANDLNAPWRAYGAQLDAAKMARDAVDNQAADAQNRMAMAVGARQEPRGGDRLGTTKFADGTTILGGQDAVAARNAANPLPAPYDASGAALNAQRAINEGTQASIRPLMATGELAKMAAETGLTGARTSEVQEQTKGLAIDRAGKLLDNQGKELNLQELAVKIQSGKLDVAAKQQLNDMTAMLNDPRLTVTQRQAVESSLLAIHGKNPEDWKALPTDEGQVPIDPTNPAAGQRKIGAGVFLYNQRTGAKEQIAGSARPIKATVPPPSEVEALRKLDSPYARTVFDSHYGEGMAAKVLGK